MNRSGYTVAHSSWNQSFQARIVASPSPASLQAENTRPANPVIIDGKLTAAHTPAMSMSATRWCGS
ncbi:MAG: hypothetical protein V9E89_14235 [Ilumatobacteraceae bacterium]